MSYHRLDLDVARAKSISPLTHRTVRNEDWTNEKMGQKIKGEWQAERKYCIFNQAVLCQLISVGIYNRESPEPINWTWVILLQKLPFAQWIAFVKIDKRLNVLKKEHSHWLQRKSQVKCLANGIRATPSACNTFWILTLNARSVDARNCCHPIKLSPFPSKQDHILKRHFLQVLLDDRTPDW